MSADSQHFQSQAVTMLAIATGASGFGLFGADFRVNMGLLPTMKFGFGGYLIFCYVMLAKSVGRILQSDVVTGKDVAQGPLFYMFLVVLYVVSIFVVGIFDNPANNPPPA